jgi:hypothetical protein
MKASIIEVATVSECSLPKAMAAVEGYLKVASMLWIHALRQPTLDGVVVKRWSRKASAALRNFCRKYRVNDVLLRIDKYGRRWSTRRGGYILPAREVGRVVLELSSEDTIAMLLEPLSPHRDRYCLACVALPSEDKLVVEVVGPGFDTSDLLRSDVLPHERFEVHAHLRQHGHKGRSPLCQKRIYVVSPEQYRRTVEDRLTKIGARLTSPAFPRELLHTDDADRSRLQENALDHLRRRRETALLRNLQQYRPIPAHYLLRFVRGTIHILNGLATHGIYLGSTTFSGTFTTAGRFVFWDFFPAKASEAKMLYRLGSFRSQFLEGTGDSEAGLLQAQ